MSVLPLRPIDVAYLLGAIVASPFWLPRMIRTGKIRTDWPARFGRVRRTDTHPAVTGPADRPSEPSPSRPRLLFHAVSVGEVNAIRQLVEAMANDHEIIVATTTDTGFARAVAIYGDQHEVVRYPFDFTWAIERFLRDVQPDLVALVELEVWPNFLRACERRGVPVAVVNGRLSANSIRGYRRVRGLVRPMFRRLSVVLAQDEAIAARFAALGVPQKRIQVVGTMKWDNASVADDVEGADDLARELGIDRSRPLVVAGSTGPGEEALIRDAVPADCQLLVAPRKPERFDEAAETLAPCRRRTATRPGSAAVAQVSTDREADDPPLLRFLLDTIGELRAAYALADVVIVGRTFTPLRGSDMIEPIGLGRPTIVGPSTDNFESVTRALVEGGGLIQIEVSQLKSTLARLLNDPDERRTLVDQGRMVIRQHRGAVERHAEALRQLLPGALTDRRDQTHIATENARATASHRATEMGEDDSAS